MAINAFDTPDQLTEKIVEEAMADGKIAAGRYISGGGQWKHLTATEIAVCAKLGFGLWFIDEGSGDAAQFAGGQMAGSKAGGLAANVLRGFNVPGLIPIFVGVDYAAGENTKTRAQEIENITNYMLGYKGSCGPYLDGMYADGLVASEVPTSVGDFVPGASGWPGTSEYLKSEKAAIIQHPPVKMYGIDIDPCEVVDRSVLWFPGKASATKPAPATSTPTPAPAAANPWPSSLIVGQTYLKSVGLYNGRIDGLWGPQTAAALQQLYAES